MVKFKEKTKIYQNIYKEKICVDFKIKKSGITHLLWEAVGVVPSGSMLIHNKSTEPVHVLIHRMNGPEVTVCVDAKSEVAVTLPDLVRITAYCASPNVCEDAICFGVLTLGLQFPYPSCARHKVEKPCDVVIKSDSSIPVS